MSQGAGSLFTLPVSDHHYRSRGVSRGLLHSWQGLPATLLIAKDNSEKLGDALRGGITEGLHP